MYKFIFKISKIVDFTIMLVGQEMKGTQYRGVGCIEGCGEGQNRKEITETGKGLALGDSCHWLQI